MTMFKLIDIRTLVIHILVMLMNGEVCEFQMLFGILGHTSLELGNYKSIVYGNSVHFTGTRTLDKH